MKLKVLTGSLVTRIVLVGITLVVIAGAGRYLLLARAVRSDLIEVVSGQQNALAQAIARDVDYKLRERQHFVDALAASLPQEILFEPAQLRPWLEERLRLQPLFSNGILVLDLTGTVRVDAPLLPDRVGSSIARNLDFIAARDGRASVGLRS